MEYLKEKVIKQLDEEDKKREKLKEHLKGPHKNKMKEIEKETLKEQMGEVVGLIESFNKMIGDIEKEPKKVYKEANKVIEPKRFLIYEMLGNDLKKDLQYFLASKADIYLQEWLEEKGKEGIYTLKVREGGSFPNILAVYKGDLEVMQVSVLQKWYGKREEVRSEEELQEEYRIESDRIEEEYTYRVREYKRNVKRRDNPGKYFKGFKNKVIYYFIDKEKLKEDLDKRVKESEKKIVSNLIRGIRNKRGQKQKERNNKIIKEAYETLEPFYKELGYKQETMRSKLY